MDMAVETPAPKARGALAKQVGAQIRTIRKQKGLTLRDVADRCGTTPQTVQRMETGNMSVSLTWLEQLAEALGVQPYELLADAALIDGIRALVAAEVRQTFLQDACAWICRAVEAAYGEELRR